LSQIQITQFIDQATQDMQRGYSKRAIKTLDRALALDPKCGEALGLKAIALATLGEDLKAVETFRLAVAAAPDSAKVAYNFAFHLKELGQLPSALVEVRRAVVLDASSASAVSLMRDLERDLGEQPLDLTRASSNEESEHLADAESGSARQNTAPYLRSGFYDDRQEIQSLRWVEGLGSRWYTLGWVLCVANGLFCVREIAEFLKHGLNSPLFSYQGNLPVIQTYMSLAATLVSAICVVGLLFWLIFELTNRRGNWLWLVPAMLACFICSTMWIVVLCYLIFERPKSLKAV
jgi:tetratricopeptide (TPR) repeat protein